MKTKKILLALFLIPYSLFLCHAQTDAGKKAMCDKYMNFSKYVFEGKIISTKEITVKTGEDTYDNYTSYLVEVRKVIKGTIQRGTIAILQIAPGGHRKIPNGLIATYMGSADGPGGPSNEAIYFSMKAVDVKDSGVANTNSLSLEYWGDIPLSNGELVKQERGITQYFSTLAEFYDYLRANYGIEIEDK